MRKGKVLFVLKLLNIWREQNKLKKFWMKIKMIDQKELAQELLVKKKGDGEEDEGDAETQRLRKGLQGVILAEKTQREMG